MTQCPYCRLATNDLHAHIPACMVLISQLDPRAPDVGRGRPKERWPRNQKRVKRAAGHYGLFSKLKTWKKQDRRKRA
jgi:hypothetical protein